MIIPLFLGFNHPRWCRISSINRIIYVEFFPTLERGLGFPNPQGNLKTPRKAGSMGLAYVPYIYHKNRWNVGIFLGNLNTLRFGGDFIHSLLIIWRSVIGSIGYHYTILWRAPEPPYHMTFGFSHSNRRSYRCAWKKRHLRSLTWGERWCEHGEIFPRFEHISYFGELIQHGWDDYRI